MAMAMTMRTIIMIKTMTMTTTMIVLMSFYEQLSWMSDNHWSFCGLVLMETQMPGRDPSDTKSRKMWPERFRLWGGRQSGDGGVALACEFAVPHPSIFLPRLMLITLIKLIFMLLLTRALFRRRSLRSRRTSTFAEPPSSTRAGSSQLRTVLMISELLLMMSLRLMTMMVKLVIITFFNRSS